MNRIPPEFIRRYEMYGMGVVDEIYKKRFFITFRDVDGSTKYTIRKIQEDGSASVFGMLNGFSTIVGAEQWLLGRQRRR